MAEIQDNTEAERQAWASMKKRCNNPRAHNYRHYGGRGIQICPEWNARDGFQRFLQDMGKRPTPAHSLDRIDNEGNYTPDNCRWATPIQQGRNRRNNVVLEHEGQAATMAEWAERTGLSKTCIHHRLKSGWSVEDALTKPVAKTITANGHTRTVAEWARVSGVKLATIYYRLYAGWSPEEIVSPHGRNH